jgi:hypothetical protein
MQCLKTFCTCIYPPFLLCKDNVILAFETAEFFQEVADGFQKIAKKKKSP